MKERFRFAHQFYKRFSKNKTFAFTLAEVLITLGVIGVVVALTIPTIMHKMEKQKWKTGLEEGYSIINQAVKNMEADGINPYKDFDVTTQSDFYPQFRKYFNIAKDCSSNTSAQCGQIRSCPSPMYKNITNTTGFCMSYQATDMFVLNNGMLVMIDYGDLGWWMTPHGGPAHISIDVNGYAQKPNLYGKDVFMFELFPNNQLIPSGVPKPLTFWAAYGLYSGTSTDRYNGTSCTYWAMMDKSPDDPTKSYWDDFLP